MLNPTRRDQCLAAYEAILFSPEGVAPAKRQLVEILLDGLAASLARARAACGRDGDRTAYAELSTGIQRAQRILAGLTAALDSRRGNELSTELTSIYRYLLRCTNLAYGRHAARTLDEAIALVRIMREAWG
jgi:flagellar protein FliS